MADTKTLERGRDLLVELYEETLSNVTGYSNEELQLWKLQAIDPRKANMLCLSIAKIDDGKLETEFVIDTLEAIVRIAKSKPDDFAKLLRYLKYMTTVGKELKLIVEDEQRKRGGFDREHHSGGPSNEPSREVQAH